VVYQYIEQDCGGVDVDVGRGGSKSISDAEQDLADIAIYFATSRPVGFFNYTFPRVPTQDLYSCKARNKIPIHII